MDASLPGDRADDAEAAAPLLNGGELALAHGVRPVGHGIEPLVCPLRLGLGFGRAQVWLGCRWRSGRRRVATWTDRSVRQYDFAHRARRGLGSPVKGQVPGVVSVKGRQRIVTLRSSLILASTSGEPFQWARAKPP